MGITKYIVKVDGVQTKILDLSDIKSGLASGAHTITSEAWNESTLISTQTRNITIAAAGYEAETTSYINRVNTDTGAVINEAYIDTVYSQLKSDASLANLLFWMDSKGGIKKDASNFISKTYDLSSSLNDPTQLTGTAQPVLNTDVVFDGSDDSLNSSFLTLSIGTTLYIKFTPQVFGRMLLGLNGSTAVYLYLYSSTGIRLQGLTGATLVWTVPTMVAGTEYDLFMQRSSTGYTLFLNAATQGEKAATFDTKIDKIGNYDPAGFAYNGGVNKIALFNEILTTAKMNNLIAL